MQRIAAKCTFSGHRMRSWPASLQLQQAPCVVPSDLSKQSCMAS